MNPDNNQPLPFFLQYLESQRSESEDTLSASGCPWNLPTWTQWGCYIDTKKYPSDDDEQAFPR